MYTLMLAVMGLALASFQYALAFVDVIMPSTIDAGQDTQIMILNDLTTGNSSGDSHYRKFGVYLLLPIPGWTLEAFGYYPICLLTDELSINVTAVTIRIPAFVGPEMSNYRFRLKEYRCDGAYCNNYIQESKDFKLIGGRNEWSQAELAAYQKGQDFSGLTCAAYACDRKCNQKYIPGNWSSATSDKKTQRCLKKCSGVTPGDPPGKPFNYTGPGNPQNSFRNSTLARSSTLCENRPSSLVSDTATQTAVPMTYTSSTANATPTTIGTQTSSTLISPSSSSSSSSLMAFPNPTAREYARSAAAVYVSSITTTVTATVDSPTTTTARAISATPSSIGHRSIHLDTYGSDSKVGHISRLASCLGSYGGLFILISIILV